MAGDLLAVLDHLHVDKAVIGGHDFGGPIVRVFALLYPDRVTGLIIMNAPILPNFYDLIHFDPEQQELAKYTHDYFAWKSGDDKNLETILRSIRHQAHKHRLREYLATNPIEGMLSYF